MLRPILLSGMVRGCVFTASGMAGIGGSGGTECSWAWGCCTCCSCARLTLRYRDIFWGAAAGVSVMSLAMLCDSCASAFLSVVYARDPIVY
jgi:hypothetical protein